MDTESVLDRIPPWLIAILVLVAAVVVGLILAGLGHWVIGFVIVLASVPIALVAWVMAGDRI
jgi:hypothetical protein